MRLPLLPLWACCAVGGSIGGSGLKRIFAGWQGILAAGWGFKAVVRPVWPGCGRTYPVMAAQRRMLKAIAAIITWAVALASPT